MMFYGKIMDGDLTIINRQKLFNDLKRSVNGLYEFNWEIKEQRDNGLNSYLHKILIPHFRKALVSVGYREVKNDSQAKEIIKNMFLVRSIYDAGTGGYVEDIQDTSTLSQQETWALIDEVIRFCAEHMNYQIPYPNEKK